MSDKDKLDAYFDTLEKRKDIAIFLRDLLLSLNFEEYYKWRTPCYGLNNKNIILLGSFKDFYGISFLRGGELIDEHQLLQLPGENTKNGRVIRITKLNHLIENQEKIKDLLFQAYDLEKSGVKEKKIETEIQISPVLASIFKEDVTFEQAFNNLTKGRQRAYIIYFEGAKQEETKLKRIHQYKDRIMKGFGFHDCVCGLSKRMPTCDGSHKYA